MSASRAASPGERGDGASLDLYFAQMGRKRLLTREGEVELSRRIEEGELRILRGLLACAAGVEELGRLADLVGGLAEQHPCLGVGKQSHRDLRRR